MTAALHNRQGEGKKPHGYAAFVCTALTNWHVQPLNLLTATFRSDAARNLAVLVALILSFSPVAGLQPGASSAFADGKRPQAG